MPLTLNGKIDRKRLPPPEHTREESRVDFVAPRTAVEELLAGIWLQVLGGEQISIRDDFFEIGGHSGPRPRACRASISAPRQIASFGWS
jgi:hypothetical protein